MIGQWLLAAFLSLRSTMRNLLVLAGLLGVAGCSHPDSDTSQVASSSPATVPPATQVSVTDQRLLAPSDAPTKGAQPAPAAKLALDGEGLRIFNSTSGSSRAIPFGIGKAEALNMLQSVQGGPPSNQGAHIDCGATNAVWQDGLTVWFARDKFVGWSLASAASSLSTVGGLKVGTTRSELEDGAAVAAIARSSLGEEFSAGNVAGLLDSADPSARVTNLWAGAVCIAR